MDLARGARAHLTEPLVLGLVALAAGVILPLLPLYSGGRSLFATFVLSDFAVRIRVSSAISLFDGAVVVAIGLLVLSRGRTRIGAGILAGAAILLALRSAAELLLIERDFWERAALRVGLQALESVLLFAAAALALRERRGEGST
jgi:hypothetical protein